MNTIRINYYGASGGFLALWVLLLGSEYKCIFEQHETMSMNDIKNKHWNIQSVDTWKSTEIWPDNNLTLHSDINKKILFNVNPDETDWCKNATNVLIYTDFDTQIKMSKLKNAFIFADPGHPLIEQINDSLIQSYNNIKDKQWPYIKNFDDLMHLDKVIVNEVLEILNFTSEEDYVAKWCNDYLTINDLHHLVYNDFNKADYQIKLQDIIKTNGQILLDIVGASTNLDVIELINVWLSKHPIDMQMSLTN